jgi:hypothetical protein
MQNIHTMTVLPGTFHRTGCAQRRVATQVRAANPNASPRLGRVEGPALTVTTEGEEPALLPLAVTTAKVLELDGAEPAPEPEPEPEPDPELAPELALADEDAEALAAAPGVVVVVDDPAPAGLPAGDVVDDAAAAEVGGTSHGVVAVAVSVSVTVATPPPLPPPTTWKLPQVMRVLLA